MAKKKASEDIVSGGKESDFDLKSFLIPLKALEEKQGRVFQTTISLDIALGGGIPEGTSILLSGKPKVGKTTVALHYIGECHKVDPTKKVFYFDVEGRLRAELIKCFKNINEDNFFVIRSNDLKILTAEDYLDLIYTTLKDYPGCICILDSVAALCPASETASRIGDSIKMASTATLMYKMFRKVSQILPVTKSTYIALTHMVANPNPGPGKKSFAVGGNAPQYGASVWLEAPWKEELTSTSGKSIGQIAHFNVIASALGPPGADVSIPIIYGEGVSTELDVINLAIDTGIIQKAGSWYSLPDGNKFQGKMDLLNHFKANPSITNDLDIQMRKIAIPNYESQINKKSE